MMKPLFLFPFLSAAQESEAYFPGQFYYANWCAPYGLLSLEYIEDKFCRKLFPTLKENENPRDFETCSMKVLKSPPDGYYADKVSKKFRNLRLFSISQIKNKFISP